MEETARIAAALGVVVGAHPSYEDREGFGRRPLDIPHAEIAESLRRQIELLADACGRAGTAVRYVKLHGALYNRAATDDELAAVIAHTVSELDSSLMILTLPECAMARRATAAGLSVAKEGFIDRAYDRTGALVSRAAAGSLIGDQSSAATRAVRMALEGRVETIEGTDIAADVDSLCVHGDSANAAAIVAAARKSLESSGILIRSFA